MNPLVFIDFALSHLPRAGRYALEIQSRVAAQPEKNSDNIFISALTDADLSVQNYFEVVLLAEFPELRFYGEEERSSLNAKYFAQTGDYEITLDPINGTRLYMDKLSHFDCILTLTKQEEIISAITYFPRLQKVFFAIKDEGAFTIKSDKPLIRSNAERLHLSQSAETLVIFDNDEDLRKRLTGLAPIWYFTEEYLKNKNNMTLGSILLGDIAGWVRKTSPIIDAGAIAFIAKEAGAWVSDFSGKPISIYPRSRKRGAGPQVVANTKELHERLLKALNS